MLARYPLSWASIVLPALYSFFPLSRNTPHLLGYVGCSEPSLSQVEYLYVLTTFIDPKIGSLSMLYQSRHFLRFLIWNLGIFFSVPGADIGPTLFQKKKQPELQVSPQEVERASMNENVNVQK